MNIEVARGYKDFDSMGLFTALPEAIRQPTDKKMRKKKTKPPA
jgi:hypothetical protein